MEKTWEACRVELRKLLGDISFDTWIAPLNAKKFDGVCLIIETPDQFFQNWVEANYLTQIKQAVKTAAQKDIAVFFEVNSAILQKHTNQVFKTIDKGFGGEPVDSIKLNPRFTFETFVVGGSNRMAHAASLAVAGSPATAYNPLFIYGKAGLGKTHLMQAIAHAALARNPRAKIKYISSEQFTNELIGAIQKKSTEKFRQKYRTIDILLIDDIQFLGGKEAAQEEFFHTFNVLYDYHKQIVVSSDRLPKEINKLEERIVSRFSWGLIVDIQPPDYETRAAILKKKLEKESVKIEEEIIQFIAKNISTNIRELEGALIRIIAYATIENKIITIEMARDVLKDMVKEIYKRVTPERILEKTAAYFAISVDDLKKSKRNKNFIVPRQVAMYLIRELTELSFPEIGAFFGDKHHTTILYAAKKTRQDLSKNQKLKMIIDSLSQEIKG